MAAFGAGNVITQHRIGTSARIKRWSGFTNTVTASINTPDNADGTGATTDHENLYLCEDSGNKHWKLSGFSTTILTSFTVANQSLGTTWDGGDGTTAASLRYYVASNTGSKARKFSGFTSTLVSSVALGGSLWDISANDAGQFYWLDFSANKVRVSTGFTTTVATSYSTVTASAEGRGYSFRGDTSPDGPILSNFRQGASGNGKTYRVSAHSSTIKDSFTKGDEGGHGTEWDHFQNRTGFVTAAAANSNFLMFMPVGR